jgi:hypothetical protein
MICINQEVKHKLQKTDESFSFYCYNPQSPIDQLNKLQYHRQRNHFFSVTIYNLPQSPIDQLNEQSHPLERATADSRRFTIFMQQPVIIIIIIMITKTRYSFVSDQYRQCTPKITDQATCSSNIPNLSLAAHTLHLMWK